MKKQGIIRISIGVVIGLIIGFLLRATSGSEGFHLNLLSNMDKEVFYVMILGGIIGGILGFFLTLMVKFDIMNFIGEKVRTGISVCLKYVIFKQKLVVMMVILGLIIGFVVTPENYTFVIFGILGGLFGGIAAFGVTKIKKRSLSEKRMNMLTNKRTRFSFLDYLNYRVLWLTMEHSINRREVGDIIGITGVMFISSIIPCMIINWILPISFIQTLGVWILITFIYYSVIDCVKKVYSLA